MADMHTHTYTHTFKQPHAAMHTYMQQYAQSHTYTQQYAYMHAQRHARIRWLQVNLFSHVPNISFSYTTIVTIISLIE